jgi:hypothetical protein
LCRSRTRPQPLSPAERVEEGRLVHLARRDVEVVDVVLEQERHRHPLPHFAQARHQQLDRFAIARQRQGDADVHQRVAVLGEMESQVVAVPGKAEAAAPALDLLDMRRVERAGAADRQADAVGDDGPAAARLLERGPAGAIVDIARLGRAAEIGPEDVGNDLDVVELRPDDREQRRKRGLVRQAHAQFRQRERGRAHRFSACRASRGPRSRGDRDRRGRAGSP